MRAVYVCADPGVPVFGAKGCSVHVQEVVRALVREGVEVEILTGGPGGTPPADLQHIPVHASTELREAARTRNAARVNHVLLTELARLRPFAFLYERYALWSCGGIEWAAERGIPALLEVNAPLVDEHTQHRGAIDIEAARLATVRAFSSASALVAVSHEVAASIRHLHPPAACRTRVVPNGVDVSRFTPDVPAALPAAPGAVTIGFAGSMKPWHGLHVLAAAFADLHRRAPQTRLLLVGDGPDTAAARHILGARGAADATIWTGAAEPAAMPGLLTSMDVAVVPNVHQPSFYFSPLKVFEYMAAGRGIVASRIGQLAEVIAHERTGLLVEPESETALAQALDRLRCDAILRKRLGAAARAQAVAEHSWQGVARQIIALVEGRLSIEEREAMA